MARRVFSWYLVLIVGLTHVGIPVFAHVCHTQKEMWLSMVLPSKAACHEDEEQNQIASGCHSLLEPVTSISTKPCCEDQTGLLKVESSYCSSLPGYENKADQTGYVTAFHIRAPVVPEFSDSNLFLQRDQGPPILYSGRELCIRLQDFRC
jgi:hypothetical protein